MKNKEELLEKRHQFTEDKGNLEVSTKSLYFVYEGCSSFRDLINGNKYIPVILSYIEEEIQKIDDKLGI